MSEIKHTPGPWEAEFHTNGCVFITSDHTNGAGDIADLYHLDRSPRNAGDGIRICAKPNSRNNAHLIAAAPELYEACAEFVRKVECGEARSTRSFRQMKLALAKADGEPS